jgi:hypothetical protein
MLRATEKRRQLQQRVWPAKPLQAVKSEEGPATGCFSTVVQQGDPRLDCDNDGNAGLRIKGLQSKVTWGSGKPSRSLSKDDGMQPAENLDARVHVQGLKSAVSLLPCTVEEARPIPRLQEPFVRGTAHEYVWLDRAPHPVPAAAAVTAAARAAAAPDSDVGKREGSVREVAPGQEAAGVGPAEPHGGHCQDDTAWWVMEAQIEARGLWL